MLPDELDFDFDEEMMDAIKAGLKKGDPNMVKVYNELKQQQDAANVLKDFSVEITPYRIADISLRKIVLDAPDYVIDEIYDALKERKRIAEFGNLSEEDYE